MTNFGPGGWIYETAAVDPASIDAGATGDTTVTLQSARAGMQCIPLAPDSLEAGLVPLYALVTAHKTVVLTLYNPTGGAVNGSSRTWGFLLFSGGTITHGAG